jgi:hypothetical protein
MEEDWIGSQGLQRALVLEEEEDKTRKKKKKKKKKKNLKLEIVAKKWKNGVKNYNRCIFY